MIAREMQRIESMIVISWRIDPFLNLFTHFYSNILCLRGFSLYGSFSLLSLKMNSESFFVKADQMVTYCVRVLKCSFN